MPRAIRKIDQACPRCGYSLVALPDEGVCPECGGAYDPALLRRIDDNRKATRWLAGIVVVSSLSGTIGFGVLDSHDIEYQLTLSGIVFFVIMMLGFGIGVSLPFMVAWIRYARAKTLYEGRSPKVGSATAVGAFSGMLSFYAGWFVTLGLAENLSLYILFGLATLTTNLATYLGSVIGERIGIRLTRSRP